MCILFNKIDTYFFIFLYNILTRSFYFRLVKETVLCIDLVIHLHIQWKIYFFSNVIVSSISNNKLVCIWMGKHSLALINTHFLYTSLEFFVLYLTIYMNTIYKGVTSFPLFLKIQFEGCLEKKIEIR